MKLIRISALVLAAAVAVAVAGCDAKKDAAAGEKDKDESVSSDNGDNGESTDGAEDSGADLGEVAAITLTKSGGLSGMEESLEVGADGNWEYVKARMAPKKGELSGDELDRLLSLARDGGIADPGKKSDKQCNDMQTYHLVVELHKGDKVEADTDECGVAPNEQFDGIVELLGEATPI